MKIKPKKSLGQNFLRDNTFIEKILTCANLPNATEIIEALGKGIGDIGISGKDLKPGMKLIISKKLQKYLQKCVPEVFSPDPQ